MPGGFVAGGDPGVPGVGGAPGAPGVAPGGSVAGAVVAGGVPEGGVAGGGAPAPGGAGSDARCADEHPRRATVARATNHDRVLNMVQYAYHAPPPPLKPRNGTGRRGGRTSENALRLRASL
jgi:hypothetical protein